MRGEGGGKKERKEGEKKSEGLVQNPGATGCTISVVIYVQ